VKNPFRRHRRSAEPPAPPVEQVPIREESIRLGQFLKLANLIDNGSEAKVVLAEELVTVNDELETRRGRQLVIGDVVAMGGVRAQVVGEDAAPEVPW
jgi:ribosome-associated protein